MTNRIDDDEYYEEDDDFSELLGDEKWEDFVAASGLMKNNADLPYIMKVKKYTPQTLVEIEEWCATNCEEKWRRINWRGNCSYTVMIGFQSPYDATMYKLRWQ